MNVFVGMEESQVIQRAFEERGHNAWSCDFKPGRLNPSRHIQGDVHQVLRSLPWKPDLIILHPVCRYLTVSGQHWVGRPGHEDRAGKVEDAVKEFMLCTEYRGRVCIENPGGIMSTRWRKPDQIIQPYCFGEDASKLTCLWLQGIPGLLPTRIIEPRYVCCGIAFDYALGKYGCPNCNGDKQAKPRWANQTDSGQNRLAPTKDPEDRRAARARTYPGIAEAMASQWGGVCASS